MVNHVHKIILTMIKHGEPRLLNNIDHDKTWSTMFIK